VARTDPLDQALDVALEDDVVVGGLRPEEVGHPVQVEPVDRPAPAAHQVLDGQPVRDPLRREVLDGHVSVLVLVD